MPKRVSKKQRGFAKDFVESGVLNYNAEREDWSSVEQVLSEQGKNVKIVADKDVYFIECLETGRIKIGISDSVSSRFEGLKTMSPTQLRILGVVRYAGRGFEKFLHEKYKEYRIHHEWFNDNQGLRSLILDMNKIHANYQAKKSI